MFAIDTFYVDDVATNGTGTLANPYNSLQAALNNSNTGPGDTIYVRAGTYRAQSMVQAGKHGDATGYLTISAYPGDAAPVLKGSDLVTGWVNHSGNIWKKTGWLTNSQQVFEDGVPLQQIGRPPATVFNPNDGEDEYPNPVGTGLGDMAAGRFFYDDAADTLYVQLTDNSNPNSSVMEASVRDRIFFADPTRGYIKIDGLIFEHGNASAVREQDALVTLSANSIFQNSIARYGDLAGVSLGDVANSQIINSQLINNGDLGITGPGSDNYVISGNIITGNNYRGFNRFWHAGGIKTTTGSYGLVQDNTIGNNNGSGLWFDFANSNNTTTVRNNYIYGNGPEEAGIFVEASKNIKILNNVLVNNNRRGVFVSGSDQTKIYHNTIVGQQGIAGIDVIARNGVNSTNTTIRNNIISGGTGTYDLRISGGTGNTSNYNDIYRSAGAIFNNGSNKTFAQWQAAGFDLNSTSANPNFVTASGDVYTLGTSSPGRDTGTTLADVTDDYAGTARPQGVAYDMGAYEFYTTLGTGLVGYWRFNENTGTTTADASGSGNTGTLQNGAAWTAPGKDGASHITFDGVDDRVNVADSSSLDVSGAMSIGGWFNHNSAGGSGTNGVQKLNAYRITAVEANAANSKWQFFITDPVGGTHQVTTTSAYSNDAWHYITGVFTGTQLLIYVDGVSAATAVNWTGTIQNSAQALVIGQRDSVYYKGQIDELRIYNRALTSTEVGTLAGGFSGLMASGSTAKVSSQPVFSSRTITESEPVKKRKLIESL